MKQDLVIWSGCICLFLAGVIWGMIPDKAGFFVVNNIHDLFEILGAAATIVAATVAVIALRGWRKQFVFGEKYKAIRDFHLACQSSWDAYWYVSLGYDLLEDAWKNRDVESWFWGETEKLRNAWRISDASLYSAHVILQHHLTKEEKEIIHAVYWEFIEEARSGGSEVIAFSTRFSMMIDEPVSQYEEVFFKGVSRRKLIDEKREVLCQKADELLATYARPA